MVGRPGTGELHVAILQCRLCRRVLILIAFDGFVVDEVGNVEQHLTGIGALAGNLRGKRQEHALHLEGEGACFGLAFALLRGVDVEAFEILLANGAGEDAVSLGAGVINENF